MVCLGVCAVFLVWGCAGRVRTALHLSQGRAGSIKLSGAVLLRERCVGAFKGAMALCDARCGGMSERSSGAGEFAVLGVCLVGWSCCAWCVVDDRTGVQERVTRSAVGASDTGR